MAKQAGPFFFTGTIGDVIFYKSGEQYLMRMKGDYNKKKMQKPGAYPLMQLKQDEFGQASKLASQVYRTLPRKERKKALYNELTRLALRMLRTGEKPEAIQAHLLKRLARVVKPATSVVQESLPVIKPQPKPKKKVQPGLSSWQVGADGFFSKETVRQPKARGCIEQPGVTPLIQRNCAPCCFIGLSVPQKE